MIQQNKHKVKLEPGGLSHRTQQLPCFNTAELKHRPIQNVTAVDSMNSLCDSRQTLASGYSWSGLAQKVFFCLERKQHTLLTRHNMANVGFWEGLMSDICGFQTTFRPDSRLGPSQGVLKVCLCGRLYSGIALGWSEASFKNQTVKGVVPVKVT